MDVVSDGCFRDCILGDSWGLLHSCDKMILNSAGFQVICLLWVIFDYVIIRLQTSVIINYSFMYFIDFKTLVFYV